MLLGRARARLGGGTFGRCAGTTLPGKLLAQLPVAALRGVLPAALARQLLAHVPDGAIRQLARDPLAGELGARLLDGGFDRHAAGGGSRDRFDAGKEPVAVINPAGHPRNNRQGHDRQHEPGALHRTPACGALGYR